MTTGLRTEELRALRWKEVDLDAGTVAVYRAVRATADTKTPRSRRVLSLPQLAVRAIREHLDRQSEDRLLAGCSGKIKILSSLRLLAHHLIVTTCSASSGRSPRRQVWVPSGCRVRCAIPSCPCSKGAELHQMQHSAVRVNTRCLRRSVRPCGALGPPGGRRGCGDLGLHSPPGSDATMMQLIPLRGPHHRCSCWHRDAPGSSRLHRAHHRQAQRPAHGRHRSCEARAGLPHHWSRHAPDLATSRSGCT